MPKASYMPLASEDKAAGPFDSWETKAGKGSVSGVTDTGATDAAAGAIIVVSDATCVTEKTTTSPLLA